MATDWPVKIELDVPEKRVSVPRYCVAGEGSTWNMQKTTSTIFVDAVTGTAMLSPLPLTPTWTTSGAGNYARKRLTDYDTLTEPTKWKEVKLLHSTDYYITSEGVNAFAVLSEVLPSNQPMYVSFFMSGTKKANETVAFRCGWNYGQANEVRLDVMAGGAIVVYKGTQRLEKYDSTKGDMRPGGMKLYSMSPANTYVNLVLLPCRKRELLVISNYGTNFCHTFEDLDPSVNDPNTNDITPSSKFYWYVPAPFHPMVQVAKCKFETSGTVYGGNTTLRAIPPVGTTFAGWSAGTDRIGPNSATIVGNLSVVKADLTAWNPLIPVADVLAAAQLTGDGNATWGLYAIDLFSTPTTVNTYNGSIDITPYVQSLECSVDEDGTQTVKMQTRYGLLYDDAAVENSLYQSDRPFRIAIKKGDNTYLDICRGTFDSPEISYEPGDYAMLYPSMSFEGKDRSREFELMMLIDSVPYDGTELDYAVKDLLAICGYGAGDYYINIPGFQLPYSPIISTGKWSLAPERGDTVAKWLNQLWNDYAQTYTRGWMPTSTGYRYCFISPTVLSNTVMMNLYESSVGAQNASVPKTLTSKRTIRQLSRHYEAAEANHIQVIGRDPRTDRLIFRSYNDAASQNPATAPALRPRNWRGRTCSVVHINESITTDAAAQRALDVLVDRLTPGRDLVEWTSDFLVRNTDDRPLWIGDVVRIHNINASTYEYETAYSDYRIIAIPSINFTFEPATRPKVREARYRGVRIGPAVVIGG